MFMWKICFNFSLMDFFLLARLHECENVEPENCKTLIRKVGKVEYSAMLSNVSKFQSPFYHKDAPNFAWYLSTWVNSSNLERSWFCKLWIVKQQKFVFDFKLVQLLICGHCVCDKIENPESSVSFAISCIRSGVCSFLCFVENGEIQESLQIPARTSWICHMCSSCYVICSSISFEM